MLPSGLHGEGSGVINGASSAEVIGLGLPRAVVMPLPGSSRSAAAANAASLWITSGSLLRTPAHCSNSSKRFPSSAGSRFVLSSAPNLQTKPEPTSVGPTSVGPILVGRVSAPHRAPSLPPPSHNAKHPAGLWPPGVGFFGAPVMGHQEPWRQAPACGRMSAASMPATLTGRFIASRRNGSPSSWFRTHSMKVVTLPFICSSTAVRRAWVSWSIERT